MKRKIKNMDYFSKRCIAFCITSCLTSIAFAADNADLAQQLTNPVASLISVPFQFNYNEHMNMEDTGHQTYMNFQPVIPMHLNAKWTIISRTILPTTDQINVLPGSGTQFGLGDTLQSFFFTPNTKDIILGFGPAIMLPTATQTLLGAGKWDVGPTGVVLKITGPWTIGMLGYQIWSVAGNGNRPNQSLAYLQPFIAYTTKTAWSFTVNSESTYDWKASTLSAPINVMVAKLFTVHKLPISVGGGVRYWVQTPNSGPKDFGLRFSVTFLFPDA
jgi:hypothetical protein